MKNTKEIQKAINKTVDELGTQTELAKRTGIKQTNISKYISGQTAKIDMWEELEPFIRHNLPDNFDSKGYPANTAQFANVSEPCEPYGSSKELIKAEIKIEMLEKELSQYDNLSKSFMQTLNNLDNIELASVQKYAESLTKPQVEDIANTA